MFTLPPTIKLRPIFIAPPVVLVKTKTPPFIVTAPAAFPKAFAALFTKTVPPFIVTAPVKVLFWLKMAVPE